MNPSGPGRLWVFNSQITWHTSPSITSEHRATGCSAVSVKREISWRKVSRTWEDGACNDDYNLARWKWNSSEIFTGLEVSNWNLVFKEIACFLGTKDFSLFAKFLLLNAKASKLGKYTQALWPQLPLYWFWLALPSQSCCGLSHRPQQWNNCSTFRPRVLL